MQFKVAARSNKYIAEYVSLKLGKSDKEKEIYIQEIIKADMEEAGSDDVLEKLKKIFKLLQLVYKVLRLKIKWKRHYYVQKKILNKNLIYL